MNKKTIKIVIFIIIAIIVIFFITNQATAPKDSNTAGKTEIKDETKNIETNNLKTNMELKIQTLQEGSGEEAVKSGNTVSVHYTGKLENGTKFDSSLDRGAPFSFKVGAGRVIAGWDQGLLGMKIGEKRELTIPSDLAYGSNGIPGVIPPNATLIFEIELMGIN